MGIHQTIKETNEYNKIIRDAEAKIAKRQRIQRRNSRIIVNVAWLISIGLGLSVYVQSQEARRRDLCAKFGLYCEGDALK